MAKDRLTLYDKYGQERDVDMSTEDVTLDNEGGKTLKQKLAEVDEGIGEQVKKVVFNGATKNASNGTIDLGNQMQPDWNESSQSYPSFIRNKPNVVTGIRIGSSGGTMEPTNGVITLPESEGGTVECDPAMSSTSENPVQNKVIKAYVDGLINGLINGAPAALDTLKELADALGNNDDAIETIVNTLSTKANSNDLANYATKSELSGKLSQGDVSVETQGDGTVDINVGSGANKDTYSINLNHEHEAMARLRLYTQATMPQAKALDTIYAQVDNVSTPSEIQKLFIAGIEFEKGWLPDNGVAVIKSPSNGTIINLGEIDQGSASKTVIVRGWNLTGNLTVAISGTGLSMNYGQLTGQSSITIPQADALLGVTIEILYSGTGAFDDGVLVVSQGNDVLSQVTIIASDIPVAYTRLQYVENAVRGIDTGIKATTSTDYTGTAVLGSVWEVDMQAAIANDAQYVIATNENVGHYFCVFNNGKCGVGGTGGNFSEPATTRLSYQVSFYSTKIEISNGSQTVSKNYTTQNARNVCILENINAGESQYAGVHFVGKVFSIKCVSGGSFDAVPAKRNSDNRVGLYDKANNVFYPLD